MGTLVQNADASALIFTNWALGLAVIVAVVATLRAVIAHLIGRRHGPRDPDPARSKPAPI